MTQNWKVGKDFPQRDYWPLEKYCHSSLAGDESACGRRAVAPITSEIRRPPNPHEREIGKPPTGSGRHAVCHKKG